MEVNLNCSENATSALFPIMIDPGIGLSFEIVTYSPAATGIQFNAPGIKQALIPGL